MGVTMRFRSLALILLLLTGPALAGVKENVAALAPQGLVLVVDAKGNALVAQNSDEPFVPASVAEVVTAWLATESFRRLPLRTRFYLDDERVLYVRGGGDPFLISEELAMLATALVAPIGKEPITGIVLDASYTLRPPHPGHRGDRRGLRCAELRARGELQHDLRRAQRQQGAPWREADPDQPARDSQFPLRGLTEPAVEPDPGSCVEPVICRRVDRRVHGSGRRQREGQDIDRSRARGLEPVFVHRQSRTLGRSSSRCCAPRQLYRQPGFP